MKMLSLRPCTPNLGFFCGSAGKESTCNEEDLGSVPGLGRFSGEGKGCLPKSSSGSQGISLKGWAVSVEDDVASDSTCGTTCLFQGSGFLLYFDKCIRSEVWHFQFPRTQIYCLQKSLLPFRVPASAILSESALLSIIYFLLCVLYLTCDYIVTHAYVWAAFHIPQFISYLSKSCLPLVS